MTITAFILSLSMLCQHTPYPQSEPVEPMTNELMFGRSTTPVRRNRYERRHPNLNRGELNHLTRMATSTPRKGFRSVTAFNRRNG